MPVVPVVERIPAARPAPAQNVELRPVFQDIKGAIMQIDKEEGASHVELGTVRATAICGNDITGSCLYTAGLCVATVC